MNLKVLIPLWVLIPLVAGCVKTPNITLGDGIENERVCIARVAGAGDKSSDFFHAFATGPSIEEAKSSARSELALSISSNVDAELITGREYRGRAGNEDIEETIKERTKTLAKNIPIDQHRFDTIEHCNGLYYASIVLSKTDFIDALESRLKTVEKKISKTLERAAQSTPYERYLARSSLSDEIEKIEIPLSLLRAYAPNSVPESAEHWERKADRFIAENRVLHIRIKASKVAAPLLPALEEALGIAELDYATKNNSDAAIEIFLDGRHHNNRAGKRYITNLFSELTVRRTDTGELLAKLSFGNKSTNSTISYKKALELSQKSMSVRIKRQLSGGKRDIRKKLGIL